MDKYQILVILNAPFVIFGFIKVFTMLKKGSINQLGFALRLLSWSGIAVGLLFAREIFDFLVRYGLTDSTPLSIADVVLATGVIFCMFLFMRLYTKIDNLEQRLDMLHERLSVIVSKKE